MNEEPGWFEAREAALNAVLGDYLERRGNPLAIAMSFYHRGRPLALTAEALRAAYPSLTPRIVILVHGMAQTESCWSFPENPALSYGTLLCDELGFTPFYLRYNTGRHVSQNGRELALLIEQLVASYPLPVEDISLLGHSMGGLIIRSACYYAEELALSWLERARRAVYLGAPHLGSPYEKAGHLLSVVLSAIDHPVVRLTGTLANLRSAGVKDLRHGSLLDEDWQGRDLDALDGKHARLVPLHVGIAHYLVAGTVAQQESHGLSQLLGDALVRLPSALDPGRRASLPDSHFAVLPGIYHMTLAHSPRVYDTLRDWFGEPPSDAARVSVAVTPTASEPANREARWERVDAYRALLEDAVDRGATAVQRVQEELTQRPYHVLGQIPPLAAPSELVRSAHFAALRGVYGAIRAVNSVAGAVLHEGIDWLRKIG